MPGVVVAGLNEGLQAVRKGNYDLALNEFRPLAEKGDVNAQASLGVMYQYGQGMERNYLEANKWYRLASDHGHPVAMSNLAFMYAWGQGVTKNVVIGYALWKVSANVKRDIEGPAAKNYGKLAKSMTPQELEAGENLAEEMGRPGNLLRALDAYERRR